MSYARYLIFTLFLVLGGCSLSAVRPAVSLVDIRPGEMTLFETTLYVTVRYDNENSFPLRFDGAVHKLSLNGLSIGKGITNESIEIPELDSITQTIPIRLSNLSMLTRIQTILDSPAFEYDLKSTMHVKGSFGINRMTASHSGSFNLRDGASLASPLLEKL